MSNILRRVSLLWVWAMFVPIWLGLYWAILDTRNPISHISQNIGNVLTTTEPGGSVAIVRKVCVSKNTHAIVHASFTDGVIYHVPPFAITLQAGCHVYKGNISIPHSLVEGSYVYHERIDIQKNPLRNVSTHLPPIRLKLTKGEKSSGKFLDEPPDTTFTNSED